MARESERLHRKCRTTRIPAGTEPGDDADLVRRARQGDHLAFEEIVHQWERPIYGLAFRLTGNPDDAADLTQECFLRAYNALPTTTPDLNIGSWLYRIVRNASLDVLRRRQRVQILPWDAHHHDQLARAGAFDNPELRAISSETASLVRRALFQLNPRHRTALVLREYDEMSYEEIGQIMHISRAAVKVLLFRSRERFHQIYQMLVVGQSMHKASRRSRSTSDRAHRTAKESTLALRR